MPARMGDRALATSSLSEARSLHLTDNERAIVVDDLAHAAELVVGLD